MADLPFPGKDRVKLSCKLTASTKIYQIFEEKKVTKKQQQQKCHN